MSATTVMLVAFGALILGHWANNEKTVNAKMIIEITFAILFIAFLDSSEKTRPIAQGLAWLFLAATLLGSKSIITGLAKVTGTGTGKAK